MQIHHLAEAEPHVAELAAEWTTPEDDECVLCFTAGMLRRFGCSGSLRWVRHWRDHLRPRATAIERRMEARGGFCDCEVFWNGWNLRADLMRPDEFGALHWPAVLPPCAGIGPRSSQACDVWRPRPRR